MEVSGLLQAPAALLQGTSLLSSMSRTVGEPQCQCGRSGEDRLSSAGLQSLAE